MKCTNLAATILFLLLLIPSASAFVPRILVLRPNLGLSQQPEHSPHFLGPSATKASAGPDRTTRSNRACHSGSYSSLLDCWGLGGRLSPNAEFDTVFSPFSGRRANDFIVAFAAVATGAFLFLTSRLVIDDGALPATLGRGSTSNSNRSGGRFCVAPAAAASSGSGSGSGSGGGGIDRFRLVPRRRTSTMLGAWRCSGSSNAELVKNLIDANLVRSSRVAKAMQATDRGFYSPQDPYEDRPQPIGFRATISAPHMHAHALEVLSPAIPMEGGRVLDVGCGSGYLTGALARLVGADGVVFGMDYVSDLVGLAKTNIEKDDEDLLASGRVSLKTGDGWKGWQEKAPYDAIHVGAAAETIPEELVSQLKVGGRMVVPVGPQSSSQMLIQVDRIKDTGPISESYTTEGLMAVVYVPLVNT